jgi:AraC-like DNA-binding protein
MSAKPKADRDQLTIEPYPRRTQLLRGHSHGTWWELWLRTPPPGCASLVAGLWAGDADAPSARHRQLPNGELWLMFNLGPPQRFLRADETGSGQVIRAACVFGLQDRSLISESVYRHPRVVAVRLLPLGAWAFFRGLPLTDLANRVLDLETVLGGSAGVGPLEQRLLETRDLGSALNLVEDWLLARFRGGPAAHPVTRAALERLWTAGTDLRVEDLACELGVSARYLNGLFHREVGLPVKSLARVLRFERAQQQLIHSGDRNLARLAQDCGYYDQSHLNRDFRELADLTPTEYLARVFLAPGWREVGG